MLTITVLTVKLYGMFWMCPAQRWEMQGFGVCSSPPP